MFSKVTRPGLRAFRAGQRAIANRVDTVLSPNLSVQNFVQLYAPRLSKGGEKGIRFTSKSMILGAGLAILNEREKYLIKRTFPKEAESGNEGNGSPKGSSTAVVEVDEERIEALLRDYGEDFVRLNDEAGDDLDNFGRLLLNAAATDFEQLEYPPFSAEIFHAIVHKIRTITLSAVNTAREKLRTHNKEQFGVILGPLVQEVELDAIQATLEKVEGAKDVEEGWKYGKKLDKKIEDIFEEASRGDAVKLVMDIGGKDGLVSILMHFLEADVRTMLETCFEDLKLVSETVTVFWNMGLVRTSMSEVRSSGEALKRTLRSTTTDGTDDGSLGVVNDQTQELRASEIERALRSLFGDITHLLVSMDTTISSFGKNGRVVMRAKTGLFGLKEALEFASKHLRVRSIPNKTGGGRIEYSLVIIEVEENRSQDVVVDVTSVIGPLVESCAGTSSMDMDSRELLNAIYTMMERVITSMPAEQAAVLTKKFQIDLISNIIAWASSSRAKGGAGGGKEPQIAGAEESGVIEK